VELVKRQLLREGHAPTALHFYVPGQGWVEAVISDSSPRARQLLWQRIANQVARTGATGVSLAEETILPARRQLSHLRPGARPGVQELLTITVDLSDGRHRTYTTPFTRHASRLELGRTKVDDDPRHAAFLDPVRTCWSPRTGE
jgi:hypothetical protein